MAAESQRSRRAVLMTGVALGTTLAGCASGGNSADGGDGGASPTDHQTTEQTQTGTQAQSQSQTQTQTAAQSTTTTADSFAYPDGAAVEGIDPSTLFRTHEAALFDAGSATIRATTERAVSGRTTSQTSERQFGSAGVRAQTSDRYETTTTWSPPDESASYVRMNAGSEIRYRIDNESLTRGQAAAMDRFERVLTGFEWGTATEFRRAREGPGTVTYNAVGVDDEDTLLWLLYGDEVTEASASITVAGTGVISELTYDLTVATTNGSKQMTATYTVEDVGKTTVSAPAWMNQARDRGVRFRVSLAADRAALECELVNGRVPAGTEVRLTTNQRVAAGELDRAIERGDVVSLGIAGEDTLLIGREGVPEQASRLGTFPGVTFREDGFLLCTAAIED